MLLVYLVLAGVVPVVCWALAAETMRGRVIGVLVLLALLAGQWVLASELLGHGFQFTGVAVMEALIIVVLMGAPAVEAVAAVDHPEPVGAAKARRMIGRILTFGYCVLSGMLLVVMAAVFATMGGKAWVPDADAIGPLPDGLSVSSTVDQGCTERSSNSGCDREFVIAGSGGTPEEIAERVRTHLHDAYGWSFTPSIPAPGDSGSWTGGCRGEGWPLDRYRSCADVSIRDGRVIVSLGNLTDS
ncbi:hypothetical protein AB0N05_33105 [Nocardia sp. NPDC051030]|uniref:hypothetical protein n=1 Tax=Nocardia sp. NPDC051030 TaxID=3155162 RepID=UPI00344A6EEC